MRAPVIGITVLLLSACSGGSDAPEQSVAESPADFAGGAARAVQKDVAPVPPGTAAPAADSLPASMIIRTGTAEVEVAVLDSGVAAAQALVRRLDGHVVDLGLQLGRSQRREARMVARVPAPRFDEALAGLQPLGEVEAVNVSAQDVGEEYVDLQAQVRNRQRLEQRLLELLATRTGKLEEVLAVERELARVREEIDRQEGRLRYLRNRVALSTLTILLHEPEPIISGPGGENVFASALRSAWRNFIGFIAAGIAALGVLVPAAVLVWLAWLVVRRARRRRARDGA